MNKKRKTHHFQFSTDIYKIEKIISVNEEKEDENLHESVFIEEPLLKFAKNLTKFEDYSIKETRKLLKEVGAYTGAFNYSVIKEVQDLNESFQKQFLLQLLKLNYGNENTYDNLVATSVLKSHKLKFNVSDKAENYSDMPEFETIQKLGSGDFGTAYLIVKYDNKTHFTNEMDNELLTNKKYFYAIKYIKYPDDSKNYCKSIKAKIVESINIEKNFGYALDHPNIVKLFGCYKTNHFAALIYEYLCCGNINGVFNNDIKLAFNEDLWRLRLKFYSSQILMAIEYLNHFQINHCDIKPSNLCLDYKGYVKLIDFGTLRLFKDGLDIMSGLSKFFKQILKRIIIFLIKEKI